MKAILIIGDGMADRPIKELNNKTPLETAKKPTLNKIAKTGICGLIDPIAPGIVPGSDVATLSLLGYDATKVYAGRGALEALGFGIEVSSDDVAFRCNFGTVDKNLVVLDRRAGRIDTASATKLAQALQKTAKDFPMAKILFKNTVQHRGILRLRGKGLSSMVSSTDPAKIGQKTLQATPINKTPEATKTAKIVNKLTQLFHETLKNHPINKEREKKGLPPANIVLCRGAGTLPLIEPLTQRYGIRAAVVAAMPLVKGVCKIAGMDLLPVKGASGTYETNFVEKAKATVKALESYDFILTHVKATDVASHDEKFALKIKMIEKLDAMVNHIMKNIDNEETLIAVTADHTTSCKTGNHEADPVPVILTGPGVRTDDVKEFSERACAKGGLHRIRGMDLMPIMLNLLGKSIKFGA
ncbi:MAG: 2,3-bisphosphoglycerate-independent phosphoglycerate mutase [Candidatus Bathyarchaeia archaeon]